MAHIRQAPVVVGVRPVHVLFAQFPIVCFTLTLLTDLAYWQTSYLMWRDFSAWLLLAAMVTGGIALLVGIIELIARPVLRAPRSLAIYIIGCLVVLVLGLLNNFIHARDGWTAIMPWGLTLSVLTVLALLVTGWFGRASYYSHDPAFHHTDGRTGYV